MGLNGPPSRPHLEVPFPWALALQRAVAWTERHSEISQDHQESNQDDSNMLQRDMNNHPKTIANIARIYRILYTQWHVFLYIYIFKTNLGLLGLQHPLFKMSLNTPERVAVKAMGNHLDQWKSKRANMAEGWWPRVDQGLFICLCWEWTQPNRSTHKGFRAFPRGGLCVDISVSWTYTDTMKYRIYYCCVYYGEKIQRYTEIQYQRIQENVAPNGEAWCCATLPQVFNIDWI